MQRPDVIRLRDSNAEKLRFANYCIQIVRILQEVAIDLGWRPSGSNPVKGVSLLKSNTPDREPWPEDKLTEFRSTFDLGTAERTLFEMLLGTGQRIGDVLKARWSDIRDGGVDVVQGKTKAKLWVSWTDDLCAALAATPRVSVFICPNPHSLSQWTYFRGADTMRTTRKSISALPWDLHSLRYTATAELARAGCSDEEIQAITGHKSVAMIRKYAGPRRQIAQAKKARERNKKKT
ncbi:MAG: tyrosine-type recombinase/integrase [Paracoccaceae bacterium]